METVLLQCHYKMTHNQNVAQYLSVWLLNGQSNPTLVTFHLLIVILYLQRSRSQMLLTGWAFGL